MAEAHMYGYINDLTPKFNTCVFFPPKVNSEGIWPYATNDRWVFFRNSLPTLELQMALIFISITSIHFFVGRLGFSSLSSMLMVGLLLGTNWSKEWRDARGVVFSYESQQILGPFSWFGNAMFLFLIGVKMDMSVLHRTGKKAMNVAVVSILVPFLLGFAVKFSTKELLASTVDPGQLGSIVPIFSVTAFPVVYMVLSELKILNSELGRLSLSAGIVCDILSQAITFMFTLGGIWIKGDKWKAVQDFAIAIGFVLAVIFILRPAMIWIIKRTPEGRPINDNFVHAVFLLVLGAGLLSSYIDQIPAFGPYIIGLAVPDGPPLGTAIIDKLDTFVSGVLLPIFISTCAMRADINHLEDWDNLMWTVAGLATVMFLLKGIACTLTPLYYRIPFKDSLAFALIMSSKGIVELAAYAFFRDAQIVSDKVFTVMTVWLLLIATIVPLLVRLLYDPSRKYAGYSKRNIKDTKDHTELRVLTCIYRGDDIPSTINVLIAMSPTKEEPLGVYALHLIELIGRATPVFISHQMQNKTVASRSCSEKLIVAFNQFERQFWGSVAVNSFTALSPHDLMHDDICTLALDKATSLILLPFHRKWSEDGATIEYEDNMTRSLNCSVLSHAPCSVGILVERGHVEHAFSEDSPFTVCLIFLGGEDDEEALSIGKRMSREAYTKLTVIRLVAEAQQHGDLQGHRQLASDADSEILDDFKSNNTHVSYAEKVVRDGPETALIIRSIVQQYDLIIVGRHYGIQHSQTTGLFEWSEFEELGVLGDLLASTDVSSNAAVLVLQTQQLVS